MLIGLCSFEYVCVFYKPMWAAHFLWCLTLNPVPAFLESVLGIKFKCMFYIMSQLHWIWACNSKRRIFHLEDCVSFRMCCEWTHTQTHTPGWYFAAAAAQWSCGPTLLIQPWLSNSSQFSHSHIILLIHNLLSVRPLNPALLICFVFHVLV